LNTKSTMSYGVGNTGLDLGHAQTLLYCGGQFYWWKKLEYLSKITLKP